jgi:hypothetical protein
MPARRSKSRRSRHHLPPKSLFITRLPAEIRNIIYHLVLPVNSTIIPRVDRLFKAAAKHERTKKPFPSPDTTLALARTCKQIHAEVIPIYFGGNTFQFERVYDLYRYLYMIGYERRRCIKSIEVFLVNVGFALWRYRFKKNLPMRMVIQLAFDLLGDCTQLKKLYLGVHSETTEVPGGRGNSMLVVKDSGVFAAVCGLENLDLRVREVCHWGPWMNANLFESGIREAFEVGLPQWSTPSFEIDHLREFERTLRIDMCAPRKEVENADDVLVAEDETQINDSIDSSPDRGERMLGMGGLRNRKRRGARIMPPRVVKKRKTRQFGLTQ